MIVHSGALKLAATDKRTLFGPVPNLANLDALVEESRMAAVERTAYRVVQGALTGREGPEFPEGGHGIESLRERVSLLSGLPAKRV